MRLALPRGYAVAVKANPPLDWSQPESHGTRVTAQDERTLALEHVRGGAHRRRQAGAARIRDRASRPRRA